MPLMDRTVEERQEAERRGMTGSKGPFDAGLEPRPTAARTVASIHGAPAQPTQTFYISTGIFFLTEV